MKRTYNIVINSLIAIVAVLAILLVGVRLFGIKPYTVLSGSMKPVYPVGSLLYVVDAEVEKLEVGDPITFDLDGTTVTHRIIEIEEDSSVGPTFRTKGDANDIPDGQPITPSQILGRPVFCIPYLGYLAFFVQNPPGLYVAVGICVILLLLSLAADIIFSVGKKKESSSESEEKA